MATLQATTVSGNFSCTTMTGGTLQSAVAFPGGHMINVPSQSQNVNETSLTTTNNQFQGTVMNNAITPIFNNSRVLIICGFGCNINNTSGDCGFGARWSRSGGQTGEPSYIDMTYANNRHATFYRGAPPASAGAAIYGFFHHNCIDSPASTSAVSYNLQVAQYNCEAIQVGGIYQSRWFCNLFEIKT